MMHCRKIYYNFLLLSVLCFTLGVSVRPQFSGVENRECAINSHTSRVEFQWNECSGSVVYRGQQITAAVGNELELVVPQQTADPVLIGEGVLPKVQPQQPTRFRCLLKLGSRAPPVPGGNL